MMTTARSNGVIRWPSLPSSASIKQGMSTVMWEGLHIVNVTIFSCTNSLLSIIVTTFTLRQLFKIYVRPAILTSSALLVTRVIIVIIDDYSLSKTIKFKKRVSEIHHLFPYIHTISFVAISILYYFLPKISSTLSLTLGVYLGIQASLTDSDLNSFENSKGQRKNEDPKIYTV
jgi:hypothetical protein